MSTVKRDPREISWSLGTSVIPRGIPLWAPLDQAGMVLGPPGSGKTLCVLLPAFRHAPGARIFATTKLADIYLAAACTDQTRPEPVIFDPLGQSAGLPHLIWDPVAGCVNSHQAERRGRAFAAGTVTGKQGNDDAARFYAHQAGVVIGCMLHAAALTGRTIEHVMRWVTQGNDGSVSEPEKILMTHPHAEPTWAGLLARAIRTGDDRTTGNTWTTVDQALAVFQHRDVVQRCTPASGRAATDLDALIAARGSVLIIGKDDQYSSVTPLLTAVVEDLLDRVEQAADRSRHGRLVPPAVAVLDELPNTAPIPTLQQRVADGRGRGLCVIYAAQAYAQLVMRYSDDGARALTAATNIWTIFGGSKDPHYNKEISDLIGTVEVSRSSTQRDTGWQASGRSSQQRGTEDRAVIQPADLLRLPAQHAFVLAPRMNPAITRFVLLVSGRDGKEISARARQLAHSAQPFTAHQPNDVAIQTAAAIAEAQRLGLNSPGGTQ